MNLSELEGHIWFDGNIVDWKEAQTHVLTYTLHYGLGVFEGVRAYSTPKGTCIFRLHDHTERLFKSANTIGMKIPFSSDELIKAQAEVVRLNNLEESYIRPMCFYGSEGLGIRFDNLSIHTIIAAWEWPSYMDPEAQEKGISVKVSSFKRQAGNEVANAKINGNYVQSTVALNEALEQGLKKPSCLIQMDLLPKVAVKTFLWLKVIF